MEIVKLDLDEIILKFKTKASQTRHVNLWLKNDGILDVKKNTNFESIYKLKKTNIRPILLKFNNFSVNEFISKCTGYKSIHILYGCLLDKYTVFKDTGSRYKVVAHSYFKLENGKYIEKKENDEKYPFEFLYNYKTSLSVIICDKTIWIDLTFLKYHLEDWEDEQQ